MQKAKGSFPGAIPVLRSGPMTVKAVAEAKAVGADGVVVSFADDGAADVVLPPPYFLRSTAFSFAASAVAGTLSR